MQTFTHYFLHFLAVGLIAYIINPKEWKKTWGILVLTMLVDLDHLLSTPIFNPNRCSIGYHPLHQPILFPFYVLGCFITKYKLIQLIAIGISFHMLTDSIDCFWMTSCP